MTNRVPGTLSWALDAATAALLVLGCWTLLAVVVTACVCLLVNRHREEGP